MAVTNKGAVPELNLELALAAMNPDDVSLSELKDSIRDLFSECRQAVNEGKETSLSRLARYSDKLIIKFDIYANDRVEASVIRTSTLTGKQESMKYITRFDSVWSDDGAVFIAGDVMFDANVIAEGKIVICIGGDYRCSPRFTSLNVSFGICPFDGASGDRDCKKIIEHCQDFIKAKHGLIEVDPNNPF